MPAIKFFAVGADLIELIEFVFAQTDGAVFETYSDYDKEIRRFFNTNEIVKYFALGIDEFGNSAAQMFSLWSPSVMPPPTIRRIELEPKRVKTHRLRYTIEGCGLLSLHWGGIHNNQITSSSINFFTEKGARAKCLVQPGPAAIDWTALRKLGNKFRYYIQRHCHAGATYPAILKGALTHTAKGYELKP